MENGHFPILCIGKDRFLLELRCQVLSRTGYDAQAAFIPEAYERLRSMRFDLVITTKELTEKPP
jgi:CheY-like chemotaxis protein